MPCLSETVISQFAAGLLTGEALSDAEQHLDACSSCAAVVANLARIYLSSPVLPEPSETLPADAANGARLDRGSVIDRYLVLNTVGVGGMGIVYAAYDPELDRKVAIKLVRTGPGSVESRVRLVREAKALARLSHPNVVSVFDGGTFRDQVFVVMELVGGVTLRSWLGARERSEAEILSVFDSAGRGLRAAHAVGLVHRDFKPDNVMVDDDGRVRVMDFGLAGAIRADETSQWPEATRVPGADGARLTASGTRLGTPAYMAPEQHLGGTADERSDQFSFCVTLYDALTGARPVVVGGDSPERVEVNIPDGRRRLSPRLRKPLLRGLERDAVARHPSMEALLAALRAGPRQLYRRGIVAAAAALVVVALAGVAAKRIYRPAWRANVRELGLAYDENSNWSDFSPDGTRLAYYADRGNGWRVYVELLAGGPDHAVTPAVSSRNPVAFARWTRDGKAILYNVVNAGIPAINRVTLADGHIEEIARGASEAEDCSGGFLLVFKGTSECAECWRIVVRDDSGDREVFRGSPGVEVRWARCDRTGTRIVFAMADAPSPLRTHYALYLIGFDGQGPRKLFDEGKWCSYPSFHPDGRTVLFGTDMLGDGDAIWELPVGGGNPERVAGDGFATAPAVSPNGRYLTFNNDATPWALFAVENGQRRRLTHQLREWLSSPVLTHDRQELIATTRGKSSHELVAVRVSDGLERALGPGNTPALAPDDSAVYFTERDGAGGKVLCLPRSGGERRLVARLPAPVTEMVAGGDGAFHLSLAGANGPEAWRMEIDGRAAREAPAPYAIVIPAPVGGWRVAGGTTWLELVPPAGELGSRDNRRLPLRPSAWDPNGNSVLAWGEGRIVRVSREGGVQALFDQFEDHFKVAVSADSKTIYAVFGVGQVRRELVENYGERPRPR
jgi:serine/threonine protein kinase